MSQTSKSIERFRQSFDAFFENLIFIKILIRLGLAHLCVLLDDDDPVKLLIMYQTTILYIPWFSIEIRESISTYPRI